MVKDTSPPGPQAEGKPVRQRRVRAVILWTPRVSISALHLGGKEKTLFSCFLPRFPFSQEWASASLSRAALAASNKPRTGSSGATAGKVSSALSPRTCRGWCHPSLTGSPPPVFLSSKMSPANSGPLSKHGGAWGKDTSSRAESRQQLQHRPGAGWGQIPLLVLFLAFERIVLFARSQRKGLQRTPLC